MARNSIDAVDIIPGLMYLFGSLASVGMVSMTIPVVDISVVEALYSLSYQSETVTFTLAKIMSIIGLGWILITNDLSLRAMGPVQIFMSIAIVGLVIAPPFIPILNALLLGSDFAAVISPGIQWYGVINLSYAG